LLLRRPAGAGISAACRGPAGRADDRGDRPRRPEARPGRAVVPREPASGATGPGNGRGRGQAEPLEHPARLTSVGLVFSRHLQRCTAEWHARFRGSFADTQRLTAWSSPRNVAATRQRGAAGALGAVRLSVLPPADTFCARSAEVSRCAAVA